MTTPPPEVRENRAREEDAAAVPDLIRGRPIGQLPAHVRAGIELTRQHTQIAGEIAGMQWGRQLSPLMRRAIASYCERWGIDANTELDVLGGSFYINAEFYVRKLGELRRAGIVRDFWYEHIHADERLRALMQDETMPPEVRTEARRRWTDALLKRVEQNAPEEAEAICRFIIVLPQGGHPIIGCKWGGNGTSIKQPKAGGGSSPNPIVETNPALSVESQAARRAMRQIASHVTDQRIPDFSRMEAEMESLSVSYSEALTAGNAGNRALEGEAEAPKQLTTQGLDPYAEGVPVPTMEGEPVMVYRPTLTPDELARAAATPSPYDEAPPPAQPAPSPAPLTTAQRAETADLLGGDPIAGAVPIDTTVCLECGADVRRGHPEDHRGSCSKYAD